ncbi:MAG: HPr family phosphocarrier protein [Lachnospiraceae bacterium]|nr:HPr family phosphocarrier protein [Lachnospiraceae bacterium]
MVSQKVVVNSMIGLHLRPAGDLCKLAMRYQSKITFRFKNYTANAKSVLSVLGACVKGNDEIEIFCEGPDEEEALQALVDLLENRIDT